ncbi:MAG: VOC family protein [Pseudomonadota bacterium]
MNRDKFGQVIWHDLFTDDLEASMLFYKRVAGWTYRTEHATDFAWGGGEKDFVLALLEDEAGAGFTETPTELTHGWIAYIEVRDVNTTAALAKQFGGAIVRPPFEVPGVGRNALLRDPLGALIGISQSRHSFPAPTTQFENELYASRTEDFPSAFYGALFGWETQAAPNEALGKAVVGPSGGAIAGVFAVASLPGSEPRWIPSLKTAHFDASLKAAHDLSAEVLSKPLYARGHSDGIVLRDCCGAVLRLQRSA